MPPLAPTLLLVVTAWCWGSTSGSSGWRVALVRRATGSTRLALAAAPVFWAALELAAARITSVPWDQLGYSQVDNALVNQLAPWTGVYGISFLLVAVNALIAGGLLLDSAAAHQRDTAASARRRSGSRRHRPACFLKPPSARAHGHRRPHPAQSRRRRLRACGRSRRMGSPHRRLRTPRRRDSARPTSPEFRRPARPVGEIALPALPTHPDLIVWPESPAPFFEDDARFQKAIVEHRPGEQCAAGGRQHRHGLLARDDSLARVQLRARRRALTGAASAATTKSTSSPSANTCPSAACSSLPASSPARSRSFDRGDERKVFRLNGHRYGVFICYEAVFADEVRQFCAARRRGARQHHRRRLVRRHQRSLAAPEHGAHAGHRKPPLDSARHQQRRHRGHRSLRPRPPEHSPPRRPMRCPPQYGFRDDITFYTAHGDVFAWLCAILGFGDCRLGREKTSRPVRQSPSSIKSQVIRAKHVVERSRIRLRSRPRPGSRPAGVSLTLLASAGNSPTLKKS